MAVKLYYFDMTGLGEPVRLMLSYGNIKFDDVRVSKEKWPEMKKGMRWNQLPKLEIDGLELSQSKTICRYLAKKMNLCGSNDIEATLCDMMVDLLDDLRTKIVKVYYTPDSSERDAKLYELRKNVVPTDLSKFESHVSENGGSMVGGKVTWADVMFVSFAEYFTQLLGVDLILQYPKLNELREKVKSNKGIQNYLANRPPNPADMRKIFF